MQDASIKLSDYFYELPEELIAQSPSPIRDGSRLLTLNRENGDIEHKHFHDIADYLIPGDVLVINNTKVIPARIFGIKKNTGAKIEFVLLEKKEDDTWESLVRPGKKVKDGDCFVFGDELFEGVITGSTDGGNRLIKFIYNGEFYSLLDRTGNLPLPPYIKKTQSDSSRYQTVYAEQRGSAAAPTAGLHFTPELLGKLSGKGVIIAPLVLHVGLGTFRPVKVENAAEHKMHSEYFNIGEETAKKVNLAKKERRRVIAVGTTSCRALEASSDEAGCITSGEKRTEIFIYQGYKFKTVNALITNFHLPESTLIMLVSAFSTRDIIMSAYKSAIEHKYRFFSFGDAMFIY